MSNVLNKIKTARFKLNDKRFRDAKLVNKPSEPYVAKGQKLARCPKFYQQEHSSEEWRRIGRWSKKEKLKVYGYLNGPIKRWTFWLDAHIVLELKCISCKASSRCSIISGFQIYAYWTKTKIRQHESSTTLQQLRRVVKLTKLNAAIRLKQQLSTIRTWVESTNFYAYWEFFETWIGLEDAPTKLSRHPVATSAGISW